MHRSDRQDVAYAMLQRYPQNAGPQAPSPPRSYEYRRPPYYRYHYRR
jgi:hypothetical protein